MSVRILEGDCRAVLSEFADETFDCIFTDPPYGETSLAWDRWQIGWPSAARRVLKRTGSMWVFGSMRMFLDNIGEFAGWRFAQDIVWEKHNGSGFHADRFKRVHECAAQFYRDDAAWGQVYKAPQVTPDAVCRAVKRRRGPAHTGAIGEGSYKTYEGGERLMRSVIYARSEHRRAEHPTQKPIAVAEPLLLYACPIGGTVLDCFAGSGTTGVIARRHGIDAVLIEADPKYAAVAASRIDNDAPLFSQVPA
ncbi:MAG: site-specific DNA-methyltransferase [Mesorhizobium sp.]|uniref:DNA-methyltransferase n=1 Tax=unclassified Mesorhizobium TaxID=325217 RepID=UPI000FCB5EB6|nr:MULTISPECIES: site-specific DNA-methyltransferase [unclassified Mesorhizobium]RUV15820.1 site-specific DNA-methyltransferase [Mesorhizobium sp. M1A.F.Ca.IN.022.04.1.1]RUV63503.1 site-specific DNA-methyltransferase [Mesorhizobium sp. M1A.F.Ca.IN.022.02.1.1]RWG36211.1 MAG: site-specific DNA-methyltransferase [Mesorhizobium sp.]RWH27009.1 MAG: site-specific DNA-methyltransferase [Mesorhizobium sp.]TIM36092.1 MAG: site-specific DNA-methyltransferase [Mesorhizobium sp.]